MFRIFVKNYTHGVFQFFGVFFTSKKSIFHAKNEISENAESSENAENAENSHQNLTAMPMGSYRHLVSSKRFYRQLQSVVSTHQETKAMLEKLHTGQNHRN